MVCVFQALQQEVENQKSKGRQLDRKLSQQEQDYEEKVGVISLLLRYGCGKTNGQVESIMNTNVSHCYKA